MTFGELFALLGDAVNRGAREEMSVVLRAVDADDNMIVCDLKSVTIDAGCTDEVALVLDGDQESQESGNE